MAVGKTRISQKAALCTLIGGVIGAILPVTGISFIGKDVLVLAWIPFGAFICATIGLLIGSIVFPVRRDDV